MKKLLEWNQWLKTGLALPIVALNGWVLVQIFQYFEPLITIFIVAAVFAFVLNNPVRFLQERGLPRGYAILGVISLALLGLGTLAITLVPTLFEQINGLLDSLPDWLNVANGRLQLFQDWASNRHLPINLNRVVAQLSERLPGELEALGDQTLFLTLTAVGGLSSLLLTVVLTLYLLLDGKRVWATLFLLLPPNKRDHVRQSLQQDFQSYFIGQAALSIVMSTVLSVAFLLLSVPYALLLGILVGVMTLIPFGDIVGYILISFLLLPQSPLLALRVLGVSFVLDQVIDQAVAPRIIGSFTGLKPIWVIIALLLGTKIFGLPGLLLAVPIASFINTTLEDSTQAETERLPASIDKSRTNLVTEASALQPSEPVG